MGDDTGTTTLLLGLDGFELLEATTLDHELVLTIQTTATRAFCHTCGVQAGSKGRATTLVRDVPIGDRPVVLAWRKRVWRCEQPACPHGSWRETSDHVRPRAVLTERARRWAVRRVGRDGLSVALVARELGVGWHTVHRAVVELGWQLVAADDRLVGVRAVGVDEHNFLRGSFRRRAAWVTGFVDLDSGRLLDVVENRTAAAVSAWISRQPAGWRQGVQVAAMDPYQGYALALRNALPDARIVVDHWHMIRLANQALDEVRRRVQQQTLGHRGRKGEPLYGVRKLLLVARQRLDARGLARLEHTLRQGDPHGEVAAAWVGRELVRDIYAAADHAAAVDRLEAFLDWTREADVPELRRLARTVQRWRTRVLAYHDDHDSNARSEAMNLLAKKTRRVGFGFRNFQNYRLRLLLHCGVRWDLPATTNLRGRNRPAPSLAA